MIFSNEVRQERVSRPVAADKLMGEPRRAIEAVQDEIEASAMSTQGHIASSKPSAEMPTPMSNLSQEVRDDSASDSASSGGYGLPWKGATRMAEILIACFVRELYS